MSVDSIRVSNETLRAAGQLPGAKGSTPRITPLPVTIVRTPCAHEGGVLEVCHTCKGADESRSVRECDLHDDKCTREKVSRKVRSCAECPDYTPEAHL